MADGFAERLLRERPADARRQIKRAFEIAYGRVPANDELEASIEFADQHGLSAFCRVLLNSNGFLYVD
jgi:hypothetical protein